MKTKLNNKEIEKIVMSILYNGALSFLACSGLDYEYSTSTYEKYREPGDCIDDVWLKMLKAGEKIDIVDVEGDGEYSKEFTLNLAKERLTNIEDPTLAWHVNRILKEEGDAEDDYSVLQYILYGELIFG